MLVAEGTAGTGFQVVFKGCGLGFVYKGVIGNDLPGTILGGMGGLTGVVTGKPLVEVRGQADIVLLRVGDALNEVDVFHSVNSLPAIVACASRRFTEAGRSKQALSKPN